MNNGLLLGLGALVVGGGIAWLAFNDDPAVDSCWNATNVDAWGKAVNMPIIVLNDDDSFAMMLGSGGQENGFLVWRLGGQMFKTSADDDWENAQNGGPFPWNQANPDRLATVNFANWCKTGPGSRIANAATPIGNARDASTPNASILLNFTPING